MARNWIMGKFYCSRGGPGHFHSCRSEVERCDEQYRKEKELEDRRNEEEAQYKRREKDSERQHRQSEEAAERLHRYEINRMKENKEIKLQKIRLEQMREANRFLENMRAIGYNSQTDGGAAMKMLGWN